MEQIKIITMTDVINKQTNSVWHKILPILLFLSFMVSNIYNAIMVNNATAIIIPNFGTGDIFFNCLIFGLVEYIVFRIFFWIYTRILNQSVFAMCIPYVVFKDQFQTCFLVKNILMGVVAIFLLDVPYLLHYLPVLGLVLNLLIIPIIFKLNKMFIPELVAHNVFRAYAVPYFIYFMLDLIIYVIEVA